MSSDGSQVFIPESYEALFRVRGRLVLRRPELEEQYELCEDLAQQVAALCQVMQFRRDLSHNESLLRCRDGLLTASTVTEPETTWVMRRVVELLGWHVPEWLVTAFDEKVSE